MTRAARRVFTRLGLDGNVYEVGIVLVSDRRIRALNRAYRRVDAATDVLAFPLDHPAYLGDVVISVETARRQQQGRSLRAELTRLLIHGLLHLLGHDHERPPGARRMRRLERSLSRAVSSRDG